jgi:hypothetical protein
MIHRFPLRVFEAALIAAGVGPIALKGWLLPGPDAPKSVHWKGTVLIFALYALSVAIFWKFV